MLIANSNLSTSKQRLDTHCVLGLTVDCIAALYAMPSLNWHASDVLKSMTTNFENKANYQS